MASWDQTTPATGAITPESYAQGSFVYRGGSQTGVEERVEVGASSVAVLPSCAYLPASLGSATLKLDLRNMCPALRSEGKDCRTTGRCRFSPGTCADSDTAAFRQGSDRMARCEYDLDLLRTPEDVSYLLRSTAGAGTAQFPVRAASALMQDWSRRMQEAERSGTPITAAAKANAWCLSAQNATLGAVQPAPGDDYRQVRDAFGESWGEIYYGQLDWLAAVLGRPTSEEAGVAGGDCIVTPNCSASTWCKFYGNG